MKLIIEDVSLCMTCTMNMILKQKHHLWHALQDGLGILRGGDFAATDYLKRSTTAQLTTQFKPIIERSLNNVNATKHWNDVFSVYNKFSKTPVNTDLTAYVTEKALAGLFYHIGLQEQKIRKDPAARVTDILKKVFASTYGG